MHLKKLEPVQKSGIMYTCPMHPEIRQNKPGSCPKCGMTLVPEKGTETTGEDKFYKLMLKKFRIALALSIPVFIIAMSDMIPFLHTESIASKKVWSWIEFLLSTPVIFNSGRVKRSRLME